MPCEKMSTRVAVWITESRFGAPLLLHRDPSCLMLTAFFGQVSNDFLCLTFPFVAGVRWLAMADG